MRNPWCLSVVDVLRLILRITWPTRHSQVPSTHALGLMHFWSRAPLPFRETEFVVTYVHGLETMNTADPGDYVCLGPQGALTLVLSANRVAAGSGTTKAKSMSSRAMWLRSSSTRTKRKTFRPSSGSFAAVGPCIHACMHTYIHNIPTYLHTYIPT